MDTTFQKNLPKCKSLKRDPSTEASRQLEDIRRAKLLARASHDIDLHILSASKEYKRVTVECDKIKQLIRSGDLDLSLLKYEAEALRIDTSLELEREESKQLMADYSLTIELPAKLKAYWIRRKTVARVERSKVETDAQISAFQLIGQAKLDYNTRWRLAQAHGVKQVAKAAIYFYKMLIVDRLAAFVLSKIAEEFRIDHLFRFKLERPYRMARQEEFDGLEALAIIKTACNRRKSRVIGKHLCDERSYLLSLGGD